MTTLIVLLKEKYHILTFFDCTYELIVQKYDTTMKITKYDNDRASP